MICADGRHGGTLSLRKRKNCKRRINPLTEYTDQELYDRFRFSRAALEYIVDLVRTDIGEHTTDRGKPLSCESVVCTAIRYLATGFFQRVVGDTMSVSQSCAKNCLWRFVDALLLHMDEIIHIPAPENHAEEQQRFAEIRGFPMVIGCLDGTHVRIMQPEPQSANAFYNRKHYPSINVMAVCNSAKSLSTCTRLVQDHVMMLSFCDKALCGMILKRDVDMVR